MRRRKSNEDKRNGIRFDLIYLGVEEPVGAVKLIATKWKNIQ